MSLDSTMKGIGEWTPADTGWSPVSSSSSAASAAPSITGLPSELISEILSHLPPSADRSTAQVCRVFNAVVKTLPDPTLTVYGADKWKEVFGMDIDGEAPPLPARIYQAIRTLRKRLAGEQEAPPCLAILMPKGLTLNKLKALMEDPSKKISSQFSFIWNSLLIAFGDSAIEESYWFVMTRDVIEGSRNLDYSAQKILVARKAGAECRLPKVLEAVVCCVMHCEISGEYLFGRAPWTVTRCQEQLEGNHLVVGGFGPSGLCVYYSCSFVRDSHGVGVCRKF